MLGEAVPETAGVERGQGPVVLFVHGQPGLAADWEPVAARLEDHRLLLPDRPGYGPSGAAPRSMAENAELLAELLVRRRAVPATVVGHSYGGGIAVLLAATRPELVRGLVLVGSTGLASSLTVVDRALAAPVLGDALSVLGLLALGQVLPPVRRAAGVLPGMVPAWLRVSLPDDRYRSVAWGPRGRVWHTFVAEQRSLLREIGAVEAALGAVRAPTVVVGGAWDVVVPPSVSAGIAAAIGGSELVIVPRAGHFLPRDASVAVAEAVRRVDARAASEANERDTGT